MATTIYSEQYSFQDWVFTSAPGREYVSARVYNYPYPRFGVVLRGVMNKVWDNTAGEYVRWQTDYPDEGGDLYPGPGEFGVDTSDYRQEVVVFGREQL
jgi:hypothetical protein